MKFNLFPFCKTSRNSDLDLFKRRYSIQSKLGSGTFGDVFCAQSKKNKTKYAVKVVRRLPAQDMLLVDGGSVMIPIEVWALRRLSGHPNIVRFVEHELISDKHVIVTEYLRGYVDLFDYIEENGPLSEPRTRNIIRQVVEVVGFCFKMGIDNRDIKEENIMYNSGGGEHVKLIDFGSASLLTNKPYCEVRGTDIYLPPEHYLSNKYYSRPGAVWAIGCLSFSCLTATTPFTSLTQILHTGPEWSLLAHCHQHALDFVKACLRVSESQRLRFSLMRHHVWIADTIEEFCNLECDL